MALAYVDGGLACYPSAATGVTITPTAVSNDWSAWFQIHAAIPADWAIAGIAFKTNMANTVVRGPVYLELATGAAASENTICQVEGDFGSTVNNKEQVLWLPVPRKANSGDRLSVRLNKTGTDTASWFISVMYYTMPISGSVSLPVLTDDNINHGATVALPTAAWTWGSWVELSANVGGTDLWLTNISVNGDKTSRQYYECQLATGLAGAEVVVASVRGLKSSSGFSVSGLQGGLRQHSVYPLAKIMAGSRISVRYRKNNAQSGLNWWTVATLIPQTFTTLNGAVNTPIKWAPETSPVVGLGLSSAWANTAWTTVIAITTADIRITGAVIGCPNGTASADSAEVDVGMGNPGEEEVITTFRVRTICNSLEPPSFAVYLPVGSNTISAGVRVALRFRMGGVVAFNIDAAISYIEDITFEQSGTPQLVYPPAADAKTVAMNTGDWVNSAYIEIKDATAAAILVTGFAFDGLAGVDQEVDIAVGAAASEVVKATIRQPRDATNPSRTHWQPLIYPLKVAQGARIAMRARKSGTTAGTYRFALTYIVYFTVDPDPPDPPPPALPGLGGIYRLLTNLDIAETRDTLYTTEDSDDTAEYKIPQPFIQTAFIPQE